MGNKATPPRSFNTIRRSQTKVRAQRRKNQAVVLLAMFATVALILLSLLVLGGFSIANAIINANPPTESQTPSPSPSGNDIQFIQTTKSAASVHEGTLILVNKDYKYTFPIGVSLPLFSEHPCKKADGSQIYKPVAGVEKLEAKTLEALNAMMSRHYEFDEDAKFAISSAYRTEGDQQELVNLKYTSILPKESEHHTGYCVAIKYSDNKTPLESDHWFYTNCYKYGFVVRYPETKEDITGVSNYAYCFRYVGVAHATYMYQNNLCLEEYLDLLKNSYSSAATRLTISAADGFQYDVYYVAASDSDLTTIDVPTSNYEYTVSGDNRSGFIVTVKKPAA